MQALRRQQAGHLSHTKRRLAAAEQRAAHLEAAEVHAVQQQFADDCLTADVALY